MYQIQHLLSKEGVKTVSPSIQFSFPFLSLPLLLRPFVGEIKPILSTHSFTLPHCYWSSVKTTLLCHMKSVFDHGMVSFINKHYTFTEGTKKSSSIGVSLLRDTLHNADCICTIFCVQNVILPMGAGGEARGGMKFLLLSWVISRAVKSTIVLWNGSSSVPDCHSTAFYISFFPSTSRQRDPYKTSLPASFWVSLST